MKIDKSLLVLRQVDKKIQRFPPWKEAFMPAEGWIRLIRSTFNMSLRQLGQRIGVTAQNIKQLEKSEQEGTITLNTLKVIARAMDMELVYGLVPRDTSLEAMVEARARKLATDIIMRTSASMKLEDQENSPARLQQAIEELTYELKKEMSKKLWD